MHRKRYASPFFCALAAALAGTAAHADDAPASTVTGTLALTSDYLFRGISQTDQDPALQGGVEYAHASGLYAGAWGSNVSWLSDLSSAGTPISNSVELDAYAGWRGNVTDALKLDAGIYSYYYPGNYPHGFTRPYTTEAFVGVAVSVFSLKYWHSVTNLFGFSDSKNSGYLDAAVNVEFAPTWTLNAHAGRQRIKNNSLAAYTDWKLGVTKAFDGGWSLAVAYQDTNADRAAYTNPHGAYLGRSTGVATVTKAF
ncbi:MAG TPA: TorF family putative porin [Tahibacter sp.]|nr:TorF family putative porin [Tahibacter sp.]